MILRKKKAVGKVSVMEEKDYSELVEGLTPKNLEKMTVYIKLLKNLRCASAQERERKIMERKKKYNYNGITTEEERAFVANATADIYTKFCDVYEMFKGIYEDVALTAEEYYSEDTSIEKAVRNYRRIATEFSVMHDVLHNLKITFDCIQGIDSDEVKGYKTHMQNVFSLCEGGDKE